MLLSTLLFFAPRLHTLLKPQAISLLLLAAILAVAVLVAAAARFAYAAYSLVVRPTSEANVMFVQNVAAFDPEALTQELRPIRRKRRFASRWNTATRWRVWRWRSFGWSARRWGV